MLDENRRRKRDYDTMHTRQLENNERPSTVIAQGIAAVSDTPVTELDPLANAVDPDAVNSVLTADSGVQVTFNYSGFRVTATGQEVVIEAQP